MLKSLVVATVVFAGVQVAQAAEFVNKDGSALSEQCIAAVESGKSHRNFEGVAISCNGVTISQFVKENRVAKAAAKVFAFENANNAPETEVCIAAATSNETFSNVSSRLGIKSNDVKCNGLHLNTFAKRYNKKFKI